MDRLTAETVGIVGDGASGALVAAQLLRRGGPRRILLCGGASAVGRGIAYATPWPMHLLNVPAGNLSALPDDPDHFVRFLGHPPPGVGTLGSAADPRTFAPRMTYGAYLEHVLAGEEARAAGTGATLARIHDMIVDLEVLPDGAEITGASGRRHRCDIVVLATGFFPGTRWNCPMACNNPWATGALESLPLDAPLLALGTGLTMIDVALALDARGYRATILAISRRGLLPNAHLSPPTTAPPAAPLPRVRTAGQLMRAVRERIAAVEAAGGNWRQAVDGLRHHTQVAWRALPPVEQSRFLRHARPYWDVVRHRMAPEIGARLQEMLARGTLTVRRARLADLQTDGQGVRAVIVPRAGPPEVSWFGAAIDCTGPNENYRTIVDPLTSALRSRGLARPHPLGIGWSTAADGALIDAAGFPSRRIYTLGPPRRGDLLESTAIPEIRVQANALAELLSTRM